ncbi:TPA: type III-A CRISPR-associated RAMP protein Csm3 [Staphylococcus pseudintermedius]|uniref:type III-A CRISPR-associated RAMP protein Csm3 n=1 Tax=Staphylococcus pseudintermedius TaxID=283734 RepID=UPI0011236572|nr:type III-A CRISPR-associated RAMP protein Csm3 [Staphylococcus pseudintermedius]EGQ4345861.1 type III-A CRISPR-associated RAMP protein Csm3 [Staphylococcus pseudintermedius]EJD8559172.1 type III-A CRISPR-associated RAMP protein Csm3 [Staphylococcus pseudintermedius]QQJ81222.1 type III-A CRISPR-associated RAMP protein Csm3 [Staphylococcus pseudintermedius]TOZ52412.1 type III-A CRISPR-associated RAMP protein Csm3 [Staphylococcus pseudintermedius]HAR6255432.1 type III-A CRISPR-associated RAMP 
MYSKIKISGKIEVVTGLHIGGGGEVSMIGAIDSPVVRDLQTKLPIIPGSSIKGKMRSLLAKNFGLKMKQTSPNEDPEELLRLFGSSEKGSIRKARLQVSDAFYSEASRQWFAENDVSYTETKFENSIDRLTAVAMPRQIERVTRGSEFDFMFIYNLENEGEVTTDFNNIKQGILLLENDYLGGGGTRGNGRVLFKDFHIETVVGDYDSSHLKLK